MGYRENDANTRKYEAKFSANEWIRFRERLANLIENNLISERDAKILTELIINKISTAKLAYLGRTDENYSWLRSNQGTPMSTRRIQQILTDNFPEFHIQTTHKQNKPDQAIRTEQTKLKKIMITSESFCAKCGSKENLELFHRIPVALGGDNNPLNLLILCHDCRKEATSYVNPRIRRFKKRLEELGEAAFYNDSCE